MTRDLHPTATPLWVTAQPPDPIQEGGNVTFIPQMSAKYFSECSWYRERTGDLQELIIAHEKGNLGLYITGEASTGRETIGPDCSLHITSIVPADDGVYTVHMDGAGTILAIGHVILTVVASILSSCFLLIQGQDGTLTITVEPPMPRKGASVTLKPGTLPENVLYCRWYREPPADPNLIITGFGKVPGDNKGPKYTGRETMDSSCSLQITDLNATDSGTYTMTTEGPGVFLIGSAKFEVIGIHVEITPPPRAIDTVPAPRVRLDTSSDGLEKLSKPVLSPAKYAALERQNVTLYCDISSNSAFNISWFRGGLAMPTKAIISGDKNLTLPDFTKDDAGTYTCAASNHHRTEESNPSIITLAYGPLNVKVEPAGVISQKVGSKLVLLCTADSNPEAHFQWFFNGTDQPVTNNTFSVDSVALKDEGNYTCQASNTITKSHDLASVFVKVTTWENLYTPSVSVSPSPFPRELIDPVQLTCNTITSAFATVSWLWNGEPLGSRFHTQLSENNRTLTIQPVFRNDSGEYQCEVVYLSNNETSDKIFIPVIYGPDKVVISPDNHYYEKGSNLTLTCTADSDPPAYYKWSYGTSVHNGSTLPLFDLSFDHSGKYTCEAFNNDTYSSLVKVVEIQVEEKLSKPVLSPAKYAALERENVTLYCDISSNSAFNISWFKGGLALPTKAIISEDKNLTLPDFTKDDAGTYTCAASNHLSTEESNSSIITLAYGPLNVKVEPAGVISQKVGSKLVLLCTADSNPEAHFQWFFNGTDQPVTNNTFSIDSVAWKDEGNYTCQASNTITKSHGLASVFVKVTKQDTPGGGGPHLSGGAIAGIVIGCVAGVILMAGLLYFLCTKTSRGRTEHHISNGNIPSAPGHNQGVTDTKPRSGEEDVQYSTLAFNANNPPQPTPGAAPPSDGTIIYSEIKKK
ncbi:hypothetical protein JRQ81_011509 [Phrynocephalus forsythii]|uniref:Ig-like domain-containing protein n=1 Tax=Phrynocephalus forsythii TaxID=171643 RepID=A0A9Q0X618_9SAUR|nr:hypothetical protein JRQ81_011509 [Phrynocephalus forsythii]